ncbi:hypothetical protein FKM82_028724 [Ascaphus truei]
MGRRYNALWVSANALALKSTMNRGEGGTAVCSLPRESTAAPVQLRQTYVGMESKMWRAQCHAYNFRWAAHRRAHKTGT